jgi:GDSL-like lipase/acylhydrolase family protein
MKENIPATLAKRHLRAGIVRPILSLCGLCLIFGSLLLIADGKAPATKSIPAARTDVARVLMIGDSLTVGSFGGVMYEYLVALHGKGNVAVYGSCGSSPEHWLRGDPLFVTKCGYREQTPWENEVIDFKNGRPPPLIPTPKLEDLIAKFQPNVVIVQLGTNWMDRVASPNRGKQLDYDSILDRLVNAIRRGFGSATRIIWITPPDSSHFNRRTQRTVERMLKDAADRDHFQTIVSSRITHYVPGKTGGDGVHYNQDAGTAWAHAVARQIGGKAMIR